MLPDETVRQVDVCQVFLPVSGFLNVSPQPSAMPSTLNVLFRPSPSMVIGTLRSPTTRRVGPINSHGIPPSLPEKIFFLPCHNER